MYNAAEVLNTTFRALGIFGMNGQHRHAMLTLSLLPVSASPALTAAFSDLCAVGVHERNDERSEARHFSQEGNVCRLRALTYTVAHGPRRK